MCVYRSASRRKRVFPPIFSLIFHSETSIGPASGRRSAAHVFRDVALGPPRWLPHRPPAPHCRRDVIATSRMDMKAAFSAGIRACCAVRRCGPTRPAAARRPDFPCRILPVAGIRANRAFVSVWDVIASASERATPSKNRGGCGRACEGAVCVGRGDVFISRPASRRFDRLTGSSGVILVARNGTRSRWGRSLNLIR